MQDMDNSLNTSESNLDWALSPWHVVHTKPRAEARALENLERQGFEVFLPMIR
jgi:hypothetical protein